MVYKGHIHTLVSHQSFELFNAKQNIPFILLNETQEACQPI